MSQQNCSQVAKVFEGWTITGKSAEYKLDGDYEEWGRIFLRGPNGEEGYIEPSCDPEGNAPGFLFFTDEGVDDV